MFRTIDLTSMTLESLIFQNLLLYLRIGQVKRKETGKKFAAITQPRQ